MLQKIPGLQLIEMQHPSVGIDGTTPADVMVALREKLVNKNLMPPSIQEFFKNMSGEDADK
jgi:hypothetical protein